MVSLPNLREYSVTEISHALKRTVEEAFGHVRVRGEISGFKCHYSGHCYLRLKDEQAVLEAVIWKNVVIRLKVVPENGLEVVVTGRITTYQSRSHYQILVESIEVAGSGALLTLLEKRRRRLAAEGLFDDARKKTLPFLPRLIGVVTSPTGAVIRDILHRLNDRFPCLVLLWPVAVQGEGAADQVAAAIKGFNLLPDAGNVPRPDVLIVARGGGSLEDLWPFNEEIVVRAAATSAIPLISAIGHETDTTLIDFAADLRAPTPTAAAEMAVPVRLYLLAQIERCTCRLTAAMARSLSESVRQIEGLIRGLPDLLRLVEGYTLRFNDRTEHLVQGLRVLLERRQAQVAQCFADLPHPGEQLATRVHVFERTAGALHQVMVAILIEQTGRLERPVLLLQTLPLLHVCKREKRDVSRLGKRLGEAVRRLAGGRAGDLDHLSRLLESYSYESTLQRGFALVRDAAGHVVESAAVAVRATAWTVSFHDGIVLVQVEAAAENDIVPSAVKRLRLQSRDTRQGRLF